VSDLRSGGAKEVSRAVYACDFHSYIDDWNSHGECALPGEYVLLVRELGNPDNPNEFAVYNRNGQKIGSLPCEHSKSLARYMDRLHIIPIGRLLFPGEAGYIKSFAETRPQIVVLVFAVPPVDWTNPRGEVVVSGDPWKMVNRPRTWAGSEMSQQHSGSGSDAF
jgi:hypothetical protein